jgi:hypothetical protein
LRKSVTCRGSSTQATAQHASAPTPSMPVELWPYHSMMLMKTSSNNWVDGPAPLGSHISLLKFLPSPQVCPNAWWCTMSFIMSGSNPVILHPGYTGSLWPRLQARPKYIIGVPCWLAYCTSIAVPNSTTTDQRIKRGGQPVWPIPTLAMDPGLRREKHKNGGREALPGGPQGGQILLENGRGLRA